MKDLKFALLLLSVFLYVEAVPYYVSCPYSDPLDRTIFFPHESDCNLFYKCDHGRVLKEACPVDLYWNPKLNTCDWPWHAGCSTSGTGSGGEGSGSSGSGGEGSGSSGSGGEGSGSSGSGGEGNGGSGSLPPDSCPVPQPGYTVYLPDPNDCSIFYECSFGVPYQLSCPVGLHFNPTAHVCDTPEHAGCSHSGVIETTPGGVQTSVAEIETSSQPPSTIAPTANPGDQTTSGGEGSGSLPPDSCPVPQPGYTVYLPDPNDCSIFYECSFGVPYQLSCPVGLHFNPTAHVCDTPEHAGCSHSGVIETSPGGSQTTVEVVETTPQPPITTAPTANPGDQTTSGSAVTNDPSGICPTAPEPDCPYTSPDQSVFFPHPTDNHFFFHCSYGIPYCKICPAGLIWHQELQRCDF